MRDPVSHLLLWSVAAAALTTDLWSKAWVFASLAPNRNHPFIPGFIDFHRSLNAGAVFGSFSGKVGLFIVASLVALVFVLYLFARTPRNHRITQAALALILAGALGNLYDRAFVKADVAHYRDATGRSVTRIGRVVPGAGDAIRIGDWPGGENLQTIPREGVRLTRQGVVRDFIKFVPKFPTWVPRLGGRDAWPWVFNIADAALVVGVTVLLTISLFHRPPAEAAGRPPNRAKE